MPALRDNTAAEKVRISLANLGYSGYRDAGVEITITFNDATGITPGKTRVIARGIPVGMVKKIIPDLGRHPGALAIGAPLLYKNITIGEITRFLLAPGEDEVFINCFVDARYHHLLSERTRYYNLSGLQLSGSLQGIRLQNGTLQSILTGGIGCFNREGETSPAQPGPPFRLYDGLEEALAADDLELTIIFPSGKGLKTGAPMRYQGVDVGRVMQLALDDNLQAVTGTIRVEGRLAPLFRAGTRIWVEEAEVTLAGIHNLESVVFGSFLTFLPGGGPPNRHFTALQNPPRSELAAQQGLNIVLETSNLGSLSIGAPVYYRRVEVGRVSG